MSISGTTSFTNSATLNGTAVLKSGNTVVSNAAVYISATSFLTPAGGMTANVAGDLIVTKSSGFGRIIANEGAFEGSAGNFSSAAAVDITGQPSGMDIGNANGTSGLGGSILLGTGGVNQLELYNSGNTYTSGALAAGAVVSHAQFLMQSNLTVNGSEAATGVVSGTNGFASYATNFLANTGAAANSLGYTNSSVLPGLGGTNDTVAIISGTSGNIIFYDRSGANGSVVCGKPLATNTVIASGMAIPIPVNSGVQITSGVSVSIQVYAR